MAQIILQKNWNIVLSHYMRSEKIKNKNEIEDPFMKGSTRKVVLDTSTGMGLKPWVEDNMVDAQFVVKQNHMNGSV